MLALHSCLIFLSFNLIQTSVIHGPQNLKNKEDLSFQNENVDHIVRTKDLETILNKWQGHITDFLDLIDLEKVVGVVVEHINDPDVMNFVGFIFSPAFKETLEQFQDIEEFKEAIQHLKSKGYDVQPILDLINSQLDLPSFGIEHTPNNRASDGLNKLITDIIKTLPIDDMKNLFEHKLHNDAEVKRLFDILSSEEFVDILKRLIKNPKYVDIKHVFKNYGLDVEFLRVLAEDVFGDYVKKITKKVYEK